MNATQIQTTLAPFISFLAGLLAAKIPFFDLGTWTQIIGLVLGLGTVIWGAVTGRNTAVIAQAASLPEVKSVVTDAKTANTGPLASNPNVVAG